MSDAGPSASGHPADKYFLKDNERNAWICQIVVGTTKDGEPMRCGEKLSVAKDSNLGTQAYNRKRHVLRRHPEERKELDKGEKQKKNCLRRLLPLPPHRKRLSVVIMLALKLQYP